MTATSAGSSRHALLAGFLGWTLDAFDFFVVVFLFDDLSRAFGVPKKDIIFTLTATLALRPVGALLFGMLADRFGRRCRLIAAVVLSLAVIPLWWFCGSLVVFLVVAALLRLGVAEEV